jgi:hypothetical protein
VAAADAARWGLLEKRRGQPLGIAPRCIEYHEVGAGGALADPQHYDHGSLLTLDIMLADGAAGDFEGGAFMAATTNAAATDSPTPGAKGSSSSSSSSSGGAAAAAAAAAAAPVFERQDFGCRDALLFVSHKKHMVQPVTAGVRRVLILEIWQGAERRCGHRCTRHAGVCEFKTTAAVADSAAGGLGAGGAQEGGDVAAAAESAAALPPPMELEELVKAAPSILPSFVGNAVFPRIAALKQTDAPNCEVKFEGGGAGGRLTASLRALAYIREGEALCLGFGAEEDEEEGWGSEDEEDEGGEGEEQEGEGASKRQRMK